MVLLRLLAWPLCVGLGYGFVVWFYELTSSTSLWRDIDDVLWISAAAWFLGPALTWMLVPADWGRPSFMVWTLGGGGTAFFASLAVLIGLFIVTSDIFAYMDYTLESWIRALGRAGGLTVEQAIWDPVEGAFYMGAMSLGYALSLGLVSWRLSFVFVVASAIGIVVASWQFTTIGLGLGDLMPLVGWEAGFTSSFPLPFALAFVVGVFGAAGIAIGSMIIPRVQEDAPW